MKKVVLVTGAGQISLAITRRIAYGCQIVLGDISIVNAQEMATVLSQAGFDVVAKEMDLSDKESLLDFITYAQNFGEILYMINGAGVSPSQASIEKVLAVDLYGTASYCRKLVKLLLKAAEVLPFQVSQVLECRN